MGRKTKRETWIGDQTSAKTGTNVRGTFSTLDGYDLEGFKQLNIYLQVTTPLVGTSPTMNVFLQRAVVSNPDPTNDAHWDDILAYTQVTDSSGLNTDGKNEDICMIPYVSMFGGIIQSTATTYRETANLTAARAKAGHLGDCLRVVEKMGGTVTTAAVYSIHAMGIL